MPQGKTHDPGSYTEVGAPAPGRPRDHLVRGDLCYIDRMEVTVKIPDEIAKRAKARGLRLEAYVEEILVQLFGAATPGNERPRTPEEIRTWLDSLAQFSEKIPPLPETISRE